MIRTGALQMSAAGRAPIAESGEAYIRNRVPVYIACTVLSLATNYLLGKDMAWDTLNYHLYLGFSALHDRFGQDYFAAGSLGYLNPYAYVPFYAMVRAGLPALVIGSIFAAVHSIVLWLTFELGVAVCPSKDDRTRLLAGSSAAALAFMNPILMQQIGSCFADITTAELALAGWLLLASAVRVPRTSRVLCAGLILGAASALKLSNALAAVSAFAMLIALPLGWRSKMRFGAICGIALCIGFVLVAAPWSYRLEREFGNPLFPMFNDIFRSPQFSCHGARRAQSARPALRHTRRPLHSVHHSLGLAAPWPSVNIAAQSAGEGLDTRARRAWVGYRPVLDSMASHLG
jgi:hypothetical protein